MLTNTDSWRVRVSKMISMFFITSLLYFILGLILGILMLFDYNFSFIHSHIILIGFVSSVIIATMFKQVPVLTSSKIFSERIIKLCFYSLNIGLIIFIFSPIYGSILILIAFYLFTINVIATVAKAKVKPYIIKYYWLSAVFLSTGATLGTLKLFYNINTFLHSHLALLGGVTFIIIGAMSFMLPMVLVKEVYSKRLVEIVFYTYIFGFLGLVLTKNLIFALITYISLLLFLYNMLKTYLIKTKQKIESIEAKYFVTALIYMAIGILTGMLMITKNFSNTAFHAHVLLLGFVIQTIMGGMYHIVPTLTYVDLMKKGVVIKSFKELYSEKLSKLIYIAFNISLIIFLSGLYFGNALKILGGIFTVAVLIVFSLEMLRILVRVLK